jgi:hypothetical protein
LAAFQRAKHFITSTALTSAKQARRSLQLVLLGCQKRYSLSKLRSDEEFSPYGSILSNFMIKRIPSFRFSAMIRHVKNSGWAERKRNPTAQKAF